MQLMANNEVADDNQERIRFKIRRRRRWQYCTGSLGKLSLGRRSTALFLMRIYGPRADKIAPCPVARLMPHFAAQKTQLHFSPVSKIERARYSASRLPLRRGNQPHS